MATSKGKGQVLNRGDLAETFGVSSPTIDSWIRAGCPIISKGGRGVAASFNSADVANWLRTKARDEGAGTAKADESELKRRKLAAETGLAELELAQARELVAPLDQVERMVARAFAEVRAGMRNIPSRVVSTLIGETNERTFKKILMEEIDQVLESLSNADLADDETDHDAD